MELRRYTFSLVYVVFVFCPVLFMSDMPFGLSEQLVLIWTITMQENPTKHLWFEIGQLTYEEIRKFTTCGGPGVINKPSKQESGRQGASCVIRLQTHERRHAEWEIRPCPKSIIQVINTDVLSEGCAENETLMSCRPIKRGDAFKQAFVSFQCG